MTTKREIAMLRQLPYFVAVAEELNFQRASERLNIAQSALSRRMRDLEKDLGEVPLFVRHARGVSLTSSGEALLVDARAILALVRAAGHRAEQAMLGELGRIQIAYSSGAIRSPFITGIFKAFDRALPIIEIDTHLLAIEQILAGLRDQSLAAGLLYGDTFDPDFAELTLAEEEFFLALPVSHALASANRIMLADVMEEDFIWYSRSHAPEIRQRLESELEQRGITLRVAMESPSAEATLGLVSNGLGLGFAPASTHWKQSFPDIVLRRIDDLAFSARLKMLWLATEETPVLARLIETAKVAIAQFDEEP